MSALIRLLCCLFLVGALAGCYDKPIRHLASDVALIETGSSTHEDVLIYLGEPDATSVGDDGVERWLYRDKHYANLFEEAPYIGEYAGAPEIVQVVVVLKNNVVQDCVFSSSDEDNLDWTDDFDWQKNEETDEETEEESGWW